MKSVVGILEKQVTWSSVDENTNKFIYTMALGPEVVVNIKQLKISMVAPHSLQKG